MRKVLHTFPLLFFAFFATAQSVLDLVKEAGVQNEKGNYFKAIELYNQVIAAEPNNGKWYFYRGQDLSLTNDYKKAGADYSKAIELTPQYFDAYLSRAILHYTLNEPEKSINDYNQAMRYRKDDNLLVFLLNNRGNAKTFRKDFENAYKDFMRAYNIDNQSITALDNLGKTLNQLNRGDEALYFFKKMLALDTSSVSAHSDIAYTLLNLKRFQESIEQYNIVLISNPNSPLALSNRGLAKMNILDYDGALDDVNRSITLYPQNSYSYRNRGMIFIAMNKNTEGCMDFQQALKLNFTSKYDNEVEEFYNHYCTTKKN